MGIEKIGEASREQEGHGVSPDVEFLHPHEAHSGRVAQKDDGGADQHRGQREPGHNPSDTSVDPVDCIDGTRESVHLPPTLIRRPLTWYARPRSFWSIA
jgi:hypothetical protein